MSTTRSSSTVVLAALTMGLILATDSAGQKRPDFSGAWKLPESPPGDGAGGSPGSGWGASFTIVQDAATLSVERVFFSRADLQPPMKFRYALDGSETRNTVMVGRGVQTSTSTTRWDGDALVITTVHTVPDVDDGSESQCEVTRAVSLLPPSGGRIGWPPSLVVETTRCPAGGGPPSTTRQVYRKN